jgi:hypothetical protein
MKGKDPETQSLDCEDRNFNRTNLRIHGRRTPVNARFSLNFQIKG